MRTLTILLGLFLVPAIASAQAGDGKVTELLPTDDPKAAPEAGQGWDGTLGVAANVSLAHNDAVVGQLDGFSMLFGFGLAGGLKYVTGKHEITTGLTLNEAFARTPVVDAFVKTNDLAALEGVYTYYILKWLGAFGRLNFDAPILPTRDVRAVPVEFSATRLDGTVGTPECELGDQMACSQVRLAGPFEPFTMNQSIGMVARLLEKESATLTVRAGGGGRETFAKGILVNADDAATPQVELLEIDNVFQFGAEAAVGVRGKFPEYKLTYGLDLGILIPVVNNDAQNRSATELTRIGLAGQATYNMFEWMALSYQLRVLNDPQLVDDVQVQNNLFLTFKYDFFTTEEPPKKEPPSELTKALQDVKDAEQRAAIAEERQKLAEEKAKLAEQKLEMIEAERAKEAEEPKPEEKPEEKTEEKPEEKPESE